MLIIFKKEQFGFVFLEILITIAIISIAFITLLGIMLSSINISFSTQNANKINFLMREEMEAVRSFRDATAWSTNGMGTVSIGSANPYHLVLDTSSNPPKWNLVAGAETINGFTRKVIFNNVYRDSNDNIAAFNEKGGLYDYLVRKFLIFAATCADEGGPGCTLDPNTKKATVEVISGGRTYQLVAYFTNWK